MGVADVSSRGHCQLFGWFVVVASATSSCNVQGLTDYHMGSHRNGACHHGMRGVTPTTRQV